MKVLISASQFKCSIAQLSKNIGDVTFGHHYYKGMYRSRFVLRFKGKTVVKLFIYYHCPVTFITGSISHVM